ncbi:heparinase II/III domain-containing protein [Vibrio diazotrophicus]|uniref:heparinase II/III domain-containing protein n=1 Tax=Vibrio diazotrophicus TaxID=685 RepID=UPI0005A7B10F|nr:heparinase II/III family protein [Vibrio diazotrophicus]
MELVQAFTNARTLSSLTPFPACDDRNAWQALPSWVQSVIEMNLAKAHESAWTQLLASDYLAFSQSGNRVNFEAKYFQRREKLIDLTLGYCLSPDERLLAQIVDGIILICEESGWQLPAHNGYVRDSILYPFPDTTRPVIDLFAAETGALLSLAHYLLQADLQRQYPYVLERLNLEVTKRIVEPFLDSHFWWMGNGDESMCNWTPWCTQNVLLAFFILPTSQELKQKAIDKAVCALNCFLKDYGDDGACNEGVVYYRHAGLCFFNCIDILNQVSDGFYLNVFQETKVKNMANFITNNHISEQWYFNFADSAPRIDSCDVREYLFGVATDSPVLIQHALKDWQRSVDSGEKSRLANEYSLYYQLQGAFFAQAMSDRIQQSLSERERVKPDVYYPSIGQFISRDNSFALSVKAGHNADSHNHNDVGNIIVYKASKPILIDIGVGTYTKKTFSERRYEIWTMQSAWHNLPTFSAVMQNNGKNFSATDVNVEFSTQVSSIAMELSNAYPPEANLKSYRRNVTHVKGQYIQVEEQVEGDSEMVLSLIFSSFPQVFDKHILVGNSQIQFDQSIHVNIDTVDIDDARLRQCWPDTLYRARVKTENPKFSWRIF